MRNPLVSMARPVLAVLTLLAFVICFASAVSLFGRPGVLAGCVIIIAATILLAKSAKTPKDRVGTVLEGAVLLVLLVVFARLFQAFYVPHWGYM